jgi:hypothetical protein
VQDDPEELTPMALQRQHRESWGGLTLFAVTTQNGWYAVHFHTGDGSVHPVIEYATPQEAVARLMQLMDIKDPVVPQDWPERVEIKL